MKSRDAGARRQAWRRGRRGEAVAALWLRLKGYRILARGLKSPVGEIDIVARRGATLAIVEVKRRADYDTGTLAVTPRQQARIARAAVWLVGRRPDLAAATIRFDIVLIAPRRLPRHLADAWRVPPGR
jgi:putative endonuclease